MFLQVEARGRLFKDIDLNDRSNKPLALRLLLDALRAESDKRNNVERLYMGRYAWLTTWLQDLLNQLALPQLKHIYSMAWDDEANRRSPEGRAQYSPPKLESFTVDLHPLSDNLVLTHGWFDLSYLQTLDVTFCLNDEGESAGMLQRMLSSVSPHLRRLSLRNFDSALLPDLFDKIKRFTLLQSLALHPWLSNSDLDPDYLMSFRALCHLSISHIDILPILSSPHLRITTLTIGSPGGDDPEEGQEPEPEKYGRNGFSAMPALVRKVNDVAGLVQQHPLRFPSLRFVEVLNRDSGFSFVTRLGRDKEREAFKEIAGVLNGAGVTLIDENGLEWRDEWNDE